MAAWQVYTESVGACPCDHSLPSRRGHRTAWQVTWQISKWDAEATWQSATILPITDHATWQYPGTCGSEAWSQTQAQCTPRQRGNLWQHGKGTPSLSVLAHVITETILSLLTQPGSLGAAGATTHTS